MLKNKRCFLISVILIITIVIPFLINIIFKTYSSNEFLVAEWDAGVALIYAINAMSVLATSYIAYIAIEQNKNILSVEERNFLKNNTTLAYITNVKIDSNNRLLSPDISLHDQQLLYKDNLNCNTDINNMGYPYFDLIFTLSITGVNPTKVNVNRALIVLNKKDVPNRTLNELVLDVNKFPNSKLTSNVAISKDEILFETSLLLPETDKNKFLELINNTDIEMYVDLQLKLITNTKCSSKIKCRATLIRENVNTPINFILKESVKPMCFWEGAEISED